MGEKRHVSVAGENFGPLDVRDRIDYVYAAGASVTTGTPPARRRDRRPPGHVPVSPWPSDHRGVVSRFDVTAAPPPVLVAVSPQVATVGDTVTATYKAAAGGAQGVAVVRAGGTAADALESPAVAAGSEASGSLEVPTAALGPGDYELLLLGAGDEVQARAPFWVQKRGARPILTTDGTVYGSGEPIIVTWTNGPANRWDWLGG